MVFGESLSSFIGFKVGGSRGMLPQEKLNVQQCYFRHSGRPFVHHSTNIQTEINIHVAWKKLTNYSWGFSYI